MKILKSHHSLNVIIPLLTVLLFVSACLDCAGDTKKSGNPKKTGILYVPLVPKPTDAAYSGEVPLNLAKLFVEVIDARDVTNQIGQNIEDTDKPAIKVIAAEGDGPVEFVQKMASKQLKDLGAPLADKAESAERVLSIKLTKFWAEEAPGYHGSVNFTVELKEAGTTIWRGAFVGENKRFGRSLSTDNYRETISDATLQALKKLLGEATFRTALSKK